MECVNERENIRQIASPCLLSVKPISIVHRTVHSGIRQCSAAGSVHSLQLIVSH